MLVVKMTKSHYVMKCDYCKKPLLITEEKINKGDIIFSENCISLIYLKRKYRIEDKDIIECECGCSNINTKRISDQTWKKLLKQRR